ncbi:hypothetical protein NDU88_008124 [Pleurodeles waltl]|uniref:Uncharacterized protein n=1 Tax=Pleurodeles waltl TaxID=8319 RepID=A0AAV7QMQ3_PLEWA|nr:hypothetical protein NDU88_008124 [Pleurodeles waltl]
MVKMDRLCFNGTTPARPAPGPPSTHPDTHQSAGTFSDSDKLDLVLAAIEHSRVIMEAWFGSLVAEISFLRDNHRKLADKVVESEKSIAALQPITTDHQTANTTHA